MMGSLRSGLLPALAVSAGMLPADHERSDLYLRFEREGYYGNVYLNADRTYVIVQTGPDGATRSFEGAWVPHSASGFCIEPKESPRKCFEQMPRERGEKMSVVSDLDETYVVSLQAGR